MSFTVPADHAERVFSMHNGKMLEAGNRRQINVLEVYAGAGGTSFIANKDDDVSITTRWAVDLFDDAVVTFATNHPETSVRPSLLTHHAPSTVSTANGNRAPREVFVPTRTGFGIASRGLVAYAVLPYGG